MTDDSAGLPGRPKWQTPEAAAEASYPGVDAVPNFDDELTEFEVDDAGKPSLSTQMRFREVARLYARGKKITEIAARLHFTPTRVRQIIRDPWVQAEAERYRAQIFDKDVVAVLKDAAIDGIGYISSVIIDETAKPQLRLDAAKWAAEKQHGKARQEVEVAHKGLGKFYELFEEMQARGETIDVTPPPKLAAPAPTPDGSAAETPERKDAQYWKNWTQNEL